MICITGPARRACGGAPVRDYPRTVGAAQRPIRSRDQHRRLRHRLVEHLLATGATRSAAVANVMRQVPRHRFLSPDISAAEAYADEVVVLATDSAGFPTSTISQPAIVARMLDQLDVSPGDRILEIGAASGYNAALLGELTGPAGGVVSIEVDPALAEGARCHLRSVGVPATVLTADGWLGDPQGAPFDRVISTVGVWDLSPAWFEQLRPGGILVSPLWLRPGIEVSVAFRRTEDRLVSRSAVPCAFLRLRGAHAGPERYHQLDEDTLISGELLDDENMVLLRRIWDESAHTADELPELPSHWFARLALGNPCAVQLFSSAGSRGHAVGFFDPDRGGFVVVLGGRLLGFGSPEPADWLRAELKTVTTLDIHRLQVEAWRTGRDGLVPDATWLLARPAFHYWISES